MYTYFYNYRMAELWAASHGDERVMYGGTRENGEGRHVADKDLEVVEGPA
jgi:hypothetical protein